MAIQNLSGPRLAPLQGPATHLVVLCHGYGSDGNDLIGLAPHWQQQMPTVAFVSPTAPERCDGGAGYQWFPISQLEPRAMRQGVELAAPTLDGFLDAELARLGLPGERLALVGFSQGTMMALHVGLRRKASPAAIVGYSGLLADAETLAARDTGEPPILLVHGDADPVVPPEYLFISSQALARAGLPVQWHLAPGIPHSIDETGLMLGGDFLTLAFRGLLKSSAPAVSCPVG